MIQDRKTRPKVIAHPAIVITMASVAYFVLALIAVYVGADPNFAPIWYGNALAVVATLLLPKRFWSLFLGLIGLAVFLSNIILGYSVFKCLSFIPGNLVTIYLSASWLSRRGNELSNATTSLIEFSKLLIFAIALPILVGSSLNSFALSLSTPLPMSETIIGLYLSDLNSFLVLIPLGLALFTSPSSGKVDRETFGPQASKSTSRQKLISAAVLCISALIIALAIAFSNWPFVYITVFASLVAITVPLSTFATFLTIVSIVTGVLANRHLMHSIILDAGDYHPSELLFVIALSMIAPLYVAVIRRSQGLSRSVLQDQNRQLEDERLRFSNLFEKSPDALLVIKADSPVILDCSEATATLLRASRDQIIGSSPADFQPEYQPDGVRTIDLISQALAEMQSRGRGRIDMLRCRADKSTVWVSGSVSRIVYKGQSANFWVWRDITERKRLESEIREARDSALTANLAKSQFLATMSHEIRTPINAIINVSYLLEQRHRDDEEAADFQVIKTAANSLLALVNDILDFSKIEAGELTLEMRSFSLREVMRDVVALFGPQVKQKGLALLSSDDWLDIPHYVIGDSNRFRQMLFNLVSNAIKFTEHGGIQIEVREVSTTTAEEKVRVRVTVRDSGTGIAPDKIGHLFKPFSQGDLSTARQYGGTGLGLSLVKRLAETMGGSVGVESTLGAGSRFWFEVEFGRDSGYRDVATLPAANAAPLRIGFLATGTEQSEPLKMACEAFGWQTIAIRDGGEDSRANDCTIVEDQASYRRLAAAGSIVIERQEIERLRTPGEVFDFVNDQLIAGGRGRSFLFAHTIFGIARLNWLRGTTILAVDDSATNLMVLSRILQDWGADVRVASSGSSAVEVMRENVNVIDLVLMDLQMPEIDGCGATILIRKIPGAGQIPILALTAGATTTERDLAMAAGMNDFLTKPLQPPLLLKLVRQYIEEYRGQPLRLSPR